MTRCWRNMMVGMVAAVGLATLDRTAARGATDGNARLVAEDNYNRLSARVDRLEETQAFQQQQLAALEKAVHDLAEQVARANNPAIQHATQESLRQLGEQIRKVDETRATENRRVFETLDYLKGVITRLAAAPPPPVYRPDKPVKPSPPKPPPMVKDEGFDYVVQRNDSLGAIVQAYRNKGIKVTSKSIMEANPTIKWERLQIGQTVWIPKPKE